MRVKYQVVAKSNDAYKCRIHTGIVSYQDVYKWIPKSVCKTEELTPNIGRLDYSSKRYLAVVEVEDWYYNKYLVR